VIRVPWYFAGPPSGGVVLGAEKRVALPL